MDLPQDPLDEWWVSRLAAPNVKLTAEESAFWKSRTPNWHLRMIELCRQRIYGHNAAAARIQKVFEIIDLKDIGYT